MILETLVRAKRYFDVNNERDIETARQFFLTYSWRHEGSCPFTLEYPHLTIPDMIKHKLIHKFLGIEERSRDAELLK